MHFDHFMPSEALGKSARVVLYGRDRMLIEQHRGIIGYAREKLTVRVENGYLAVLGADLRIDQYSGQDLSLSGRIDAVEFS